MRGVHSGSGPSSKLSASFFGMVAHVRDGVRERHARLIVSESICLESSSMVRVRTPFLGWPDTRMMSPSPSISRSQPGGTDARSFMGTSPSWAGPRSSTAIDPPRPTATARTSEYPIRGPLASRCTWSPHPKTTPGAAQVLVFVVVRKVRVARRIVQVHLRAGIGCSLPHLLRRHVVAVHNRRLNDRFACRLCRAWPLGRVKTPAVSSSSSHSHSCRSRR